MIKKIFKKSPTKDNQTHPKQIQAVTETSNYRNEANSNLQLAPSKVIKLRLILLLLFI